MDWHYRRQYSLNCPLTLLRALPPAVISFVDLRKPPELSTLIHILLDKRSIKLDTRGKHNGASPSPRTLGRNKPDKVTRSTPRGSIYGVSGNLGVSVDTKSQTKTTPPTVTVAVLINDPNMDMQQAHVRNMRSKC